MKKMYKRLVVILVISTLLLSACVARSEGSNEEEVVKELGLSDSKVVTINDKTFDEDDLKFYTLMNKVKLELQMVASKDEKEKAYYEEQLVYYDNVNVNLHSLIEMYAMSLLAEEKNYFIPDEKLQDAVTTFNKKVEGDEETVTLVESYGRELYNRNIQEYVRQTMLRDRIAGELEAELQEKNPDAGKEEINYLLDGKFEDLYMDQVSTLDMEIHLE